MEKSPFPVTIKWADIGRAALGAVWDAVYKYTTPNPNGYRGEHFIHEDPENLGYIALCESDDGLDYDWTRYDGNDVVHTPPNRWDDQGNYFDGQE